MPQYIESTNINYEIPKPKMKTAATNDDPVILRCVADVPQCKNISSTERFHSLFVIWMFGVSFQITQHSNSFLFFQTMTFAFGFIMLCQSEFRSSRSYSLDLFGTVLLTVTVISFGDPKLSDMTTSMKVIVFVTATHLSATKEDCEKHVDTD